MPRTTPELVAGVPDVFSGLTEKDESVDLTVYILTANELVTECCTGDAGPTVPYSEERLELIERWLAAWAYHQRDLIATTEAAGSVQQTARVELEIGFNNNYFGQTAMRLDTNGGLAALDAGTTKGGKKLGSVSWLGKAPDVIEID